MPLPIPCEPDCPDRSIYCHSKCDKYKEYLGKNEKLKETKKKATLEIYASSKKSFVPY